MVSGEEPKQSDQKPKQLPEKEVECRSSSSVFSPGFRSVAAMAGWDEEALIVASLVVEDTPDRHLKHKKRSVLPLKSPPSSSRRKRRAQRRSPASIPVAVFNLDEDESPTEESETSKKKESNIEVKSDKKVGNDEPNGQGSGVSSSSLAIPCMDKLRDELSCAICLEICFEPSTTPCGHSFCKKCLRSAADKCGKRCPKCRQLISNGRSCTVNTVLWNTIQLLFPKEVEARKAAASSNSREATRQTPAKGSHRNVRNQRVLLALDDSPESEYMNLERRRSSSSRHLRNRSVHPSGQTSRENAVVSVRRSREVVPNQDEDAALALRLQREEFMEAFRGPEEQPRSSIVTARANLRAMASRAIDIRVRRRET